MRRGRGGERRRQAAVWAALALCAGLVAACGAGTVSSQAAPGGFATPSSPSFPPPSGPAGLPGVEFGNRVTPAPTFTLDPYRGLGAWVDVFDWSITYMPNTATSPVVDLTAIDRMAQRGVTTLFIQTARYDNPAHLLEPERLSGLVDRAHQQGMHVVAWYLPVFEDPATDLRRLLQPITLGVDGIAVDIEARIVPDVAERTRRLVLLSEQLRAALGPGPKLGAIVLPPTVMEDVNPSYWVGYPWTELGRSYDVFLPMNYWTNRLASSPWRDARASTAENIARVRTRTGRADLAVHPIGGSAAQVIPAEVDAMREAAAQGGAIGGSLYDYASTPEALWPALAGFRAR